MKNIFIHLGIIFILIGFSLIAVDEVSAQIKNYYDDIEASKEIKKNVNDYYDQFKNKALDVKKEIVDTSSSFNIYFEDFTKSYITISNKMDNVKSKITDLDDISQKLFNYCRYDLNDSVMNNKCKSFKTNYKNMYNSFQTMVDNYNKIVNSYNTYATKKKLNSISPYQKEIEFSDNLIKKFS